MRVEIGKGMNIYAAIEYASGQARFHQQEVFFEFNEIMLTCRHDSNKLDIAAIYDLKHRIRRLEAGYKN